MLLILLDGLRGKLPQGVDRHPSRVREGAASSPTMTPVRN